MYMYNKTCTIFDFVIRKMPSILFNYIHKSEIIPKMNILTLCKLQHFQDLIKMFLTTVKQVKLEVRPLFLPQLVQLTSMLKPGLYSICVSS